MTQPPQPPPQHPQHPHPQHPPQQPQPGRHTAEEPPEQVGFQGAPPAPGNPPTGRAQVGRAQVSPAAAPQYGQARPAPATYGGGSYTAAQPASAPPAPSAAYGQPPAGYGPAGGQVPPNPAAYGQPAQPGYGAYEQPQQQPVQQRTQSQPILGRSAQTQAAQTQAAQTQAAQAQAAQAQAAQAQAAQAQVQAAQAAQAQAAQAQAAQAQAAQAHAAYAAYQAQAAQAAAQARAQQQQQVQAQPQVPQQRQGQGPTEVRPAIAQPQFDLERSLSRTAAPNLPWQAAQAAASAVTAAPEPAAAAPEDLAARQEGPGGTPPAGAARGGADRQRRALSLSLPQLHIGWHEVNAAALKHVRGGTGATGLMLGVDYQRQPVPIRFFRPEATRVTLVGGLWAQRILVFRALALGARVIVMTNDPRPWQGLGEWATGLSDRLVLWNDPRPPTAPASPRQPLLIVTDVSQVGFGARPELGAWQTQVTVVRRLGAEHAHALHGCNLVMLQRLSRQEAAVAGSALNLSESGTGLLQEMTPEMLALMGSGANRYVWLSPTSVEQQYHGPPQR